MIDRHAKITTTTEEIITMLFENDSAIQTEIRLITESPLCAMNGAKGVKGRKDCKGPKRDKGDNQDDRIDRDQRKFFHYHQRGYITKNCMGKQYGNPLYGANTAAKALTEPTSTITTLIKNDLMVPSSNTSCSMWFVDCRCTTYISGSRLLFITYPDYAANRNKAR